MLTFIVYIVDQQTRQFLYCKRRGSKQIHCPIYATDRRYAIWINWSRCLYEEVSAIASWSTVAALVDHRFEVQLLTL